MLGFGMAVCTTVVFVAQIYAIYRGLVEPSLNRKLEKANRELEEARGACSSCSVIEVMVNRSDKLGRVILVADDIACWCELVCGLMAGIGVFSVLCGLIFGF